jgi:hypothetical protein
MLNRIPKTLPSFNELLLNLGRPTLSDVAKSLDVSEYTVRRWVKTNAAPKSAKLSLYWLTHWGRHAVDTDMAFELQNTRELAAAYAREGVKLKQSIAHLIRVGDFGAANEPIQVDA